MTVRAQIDFHCDVDNSNFFHDGTQKHIITNERTKAKSFFTGK
jgi:hypothetical protein